MVGAIAIIADVFSVAAFLFGIYQYRKEKKRENKMATIEAYTDLQRDVFSVLNKWRPSDIRETVLDNKSSAYKDLSNYLARIECFCAGINHGIYDFDAFYDVAHGYFDKGGSLYRRLFPILEKKLDSAREDYFQNIHKVWKRMDERSESGLYKEVHK